MPSSMSPRPTPTPLRLALLLSLVLAACGSKPSATSATATPATAPVPTSPAPADRELPVDDRIRTGKLENGLTYYVLEHRKPEQRAQLWLAVNAGSILEDDDQLGLAHFVEHMAFNGTEQFEKQAIIDYLEKIGMDFGADVNAYTSFDQTVYMLQVPTDDASMVEQGLTILHEWASAVTFDPVEVDKERGVVLEEWRLGRGAWKRILDQQMPVLFRGSRYAERLPIGKREIIEGAPRDALVRFYRDWYRPDLMAIVAVGDFDGAEMQAEIERRFGGLENPDEPRERIEPGVPPHDEPLVHIATDPEMTRTQVAIHDIFPRRPERTVGDYRRFVVERLYHEMLTARLDEIRQRPDSPFVFAYSSSGTFVRNAGAFNRTAAVKQDAVERGLQTLLEEVERVERHGFTGGELERAKRSLVRGYQQSVKERSKTDGRELAAEIVRHFTEGEMMPGIEAELTLVEQFLPTIALDELNALARGGDDHSRVVLISGPEGLDAPSEQDVLALATEIESRELAAYEDRATDAPLLAEKPAPGKVTGTRTIDEIGVTEWTLSNGVKVVLKPTDFQNDEVRFSAFSPGGHSLVPDEAYASARFAAQIVSAAGIGEFDPALLDKKLAGKVADAWAYISELEEGMSGRASPEDLETLMQLIYLRFTAPRRDEDAFAAWRARTAEWVKNRRLDPQSAFFDDMLAVLSQNHLRRRPVTPKTLEQVDLDQALAIYRERFADASDFTFVFVGNLDLEAARPLIETYLGGLPSSARDERWRDVGVRVPRGVKESTTRRGLEPKSFVFLAFHGKQPWSREAANDMRMLSEVLRIRLREVLREDMGGVYGVFAGGEIERRPRPEYGYSVFFGCAPENVTRLKQAVFDEIAALKKNGIGDDYLIKVRNKRIRQREIDLRENGYWTYELADAYRYGDDPRAILDVEELDAAITSDRVRAAARRYLRPKQYVLGVLRPEADAPK